MTHSVRRSAKSGLAPGTLVYIGRGDKNPHEMELIKYNQDAFFHNKYSEFSPGLFANTDQNLWLHVTGINNVDTLKRIGESLSIHVLTLEDILNTEQRPKIENFDTYHYLVIKMLFYDQENDAILQEQLSLIIHGNRVVTFQDKGEDLFAPVRERMGNPDSRLRAYGADYLLYALLDAVVDNYFLILERLGDRLEEIEEEIIVNSSTEMLHRLYRMKRDVILLRKTIWPLREVVNYLEKTDHGFIKQPTKVFLRDLYDHTIQIIDNIESLRDIISGMVEIHLTTISNRMNSVMKVLTIISTIFIPLTFIAGIYGMNFQFMPELNWRWSYPMILLLMLGIGIVMLVIFKKKRWL